MNRYHSKFTDSFPCVSLKIIKCCIECAVTHMRQWHISNAQNLYSWKLAFESNWPKLSLLFLDPAIQHLSLVGIQLYRRMGKSGVGREKLFKFEKLHCPKRIETHTRLAQGLSFALFIASTNIVSICLHRFIVPTYTVHQRKFSEKAKRPL